MLRRSMWIVWLTPSPSAATTRSDVAAQHVDRVVAADGEGVAVAGGDPHVEVGPRHFQPGGHRRGAAVDGVEAEGVHVIREPAGAADAGHHHELLARDAELREDRLHRGQDRVVAAARAPAHFLVGLEVLLRVDGRKRRGRHCPSTSSILASISDCLNGLPWILLKPSASTRYLARSTQRSWPRFISGTITFL